jgi:hypothetical protein
LLYQIESEGVDFENIFAYADDILVLCKSREELEKCIRIIKEWGENNGLILSPKKSGIVEFIRRKGRKRAL